MSVPIRVDLAVVGGGILGRAVALRLADDGHNVAAIYRRADLARQASAAAGAMLGVWSEVSAAAPPARSESDIRHRLEARMLYDAWVNGLRESTAIAVSITPGLFVIANNEGDDDALALRAIRDAAHHTGGVAESIAPPDVPGLAPARRARAFEALHLPGEGTVDTIVLLEALDTALERHPRVAVLDDRAVAIDARATGVEATLATGEIVECAEIVLAGGAELTSLLVESNLADTAAVPVVFGGRGVSAVVHAPFAVPTGVRTPNRSFACGLHLVPRANGGVYVGATNRFTTAPEPNAHARLSELEYLLAGATREFNTRFAEAELLSVAVGSRPLTLDKQPLAGRTEHPRVHVATGTYRNGVLLAPLIAQIVGEEIAHPGTHLEHPYSPRRKIDVAGADWLRDAGRHLVDLLTQSGAGIDEGRDPRLERFLDRALDALLGNDTDDRLRRKLERLAARAPIEEVVPLLFETVARHESP